MSLRLVARDLYLVIREVERLEKEIADTPYEKRGRLEDMLRKAKAEEKQIRAMLEAKKQFSGKTPFR